MTDELMFLTLESPELSVRLTNWGARLLSVCYQGVDCLYGPKTEEELRADACYCGSVCGRVANRIAGGCFELDGVGYQLACNNGPNHLHGGAVGFSDRLWRTELAEPSRVVLSLLSPAGEEGYPGTVRVRATYALEGRALRLELAAETDAPTLVNLTHHAYWNLDGRGTVEQHCLQVDAEQMTPMVANIPTGEVAAVQGTPYDLRRPVLLGERMAAALPGGFDDNYVLSPAPGVRRAALLTNGRRTLRVSTDAPGMQVYTGDYLPLPRGGVALEAQCYPDAPHHAHFPSIVLRPGVLSLRTIVWELD